MKFLSSYKLSSEGKKNLDEATKLLEEWKKDKENTELYNKYLNAYGVVVRSLGEEDSKDFQNKMMEALQKMELMTESSSESETKKEFTPYNIKKVVCSLQQDMYKLMQHDCSCAIVQVQSIPMIYNSYVGTYTGEWKGCAPCGRGEFIGKEMKEDTTSSDVSAVFHYEGDWKGGLPEGQGEYYYYKYYSSADTTDHSLTFAYRGGMKAGMTDGKGVMFDIYSGNKYFYSEGTFKENKLIGQVDFAHYEPDGSLFGVGYVVDDEEDSFVPHVRIAKYTDSKEIQEKKEITKTQMAMVAGAVIGTVIGVYLGSKIIKMDKTEESIMKGLEDRSEQMNQFLNEQRKAEEESIREADAYAAAQEAERRNYEVMYEKAHQSDPDDYLINTRQLKALAQR